MLPRIAKFLPHPGRGLAAAALFALTPKCFLCLAAYATAAAGLGLGGRELCGGSVGAADSGASSMLSLLSIVLAAVGFFVASRGRCGANATIPALTRRATSE